MSIRSPSCRLLIELAFGYPDRLFRAIGHPVTWIGRLISFLDRKLNRATDSDAHASPPGCRGVAGHRARAVGDCLRCANPALAHSPSGLLVAAILASLAAGAEQPGRACRGGGRRARDRRTHRRAASLSSQIVGRDPERLDEAGVCRAAIESLAENFSDGIVAPAFWLGVGGLAGGVAYKAANTANSMIGHRTPRHEAFGWAAARFDDLINLPASRLTALLIVLAAFLVRGADARNAWRAVRRDAKKHRSPNAGWPEAAMAGALGLALAGPRSYGGVMVDDAFMGEGGRREAESVDIRRALRLYWTADVPADRCCLE